jgi:hypothetical protein
MNTEQIDSMESVIDNWGFHGFTRVNGWKRKVKPMDAAWQADYSDGTLHTRVRFHIRKVMAGHYIVGAVLEINEDIEVKSYQISEPTPAQITVGLVHIFAGLKDSIVEWRRAA